MSKVLQAIETVDDEGSDYDLFTVTAAIRDTPKFVGHTKDPQDVLDTAKFYGCQYVTFKLSLSEI